VKKRISLLPRRSAAFCACRMRQNEAGTADDSYDGIAFNRIGKRSAPTTTESAGDVKPPIIVPGYSFIPGATDNIPYLTASELVVNGIGTGTIREQLVEILGKPLSVEEQDEITEIYRYSNADIYFYHGEIVLFLITDYMDRTPRNIQVGDTFQEIIDKFPQERDFNTSEGHLFYGTWIPPRAMISR